MKIRTDFVTNSSSSSFVCEICGRSESGYDMCLSDAEMMECVNGHTFCCDESLPKPAKEEMIKMIIENEWNKDAWSSDLKDYKDYSEDELLVMEEDELWGFCCEDSGCYEVPECVCPICQFIEYSEYDLSAYLLKQYGVPREDVFAEVKKLNKRRKKLYENEYITHVCKQFNLNPTEIIAGWKESFNTYEKFKSWLNEK